MQLQPAASKAIKHKLPPRELAVIRLPSFEEVANDQVLYAHANRILHLETNPGNARALVQRHGERDVWINPPPIPLTTEEMDYVFDLPYARLPHPSYGNARFPAFDMIKFSVNIMRGCFGGCTFCSITEHEGRIIQNRSEDSILREIEKFGILRRSLPGSFRIWVAQRQTCTVCIVKIQKLKRTAVNRRVFIRAFVRICILIMHLWYSYTVKPARSRA